MIDYSNCALFRRSWNKNRSWDYQGRLARTVYLWPARQELRYILYLNQTKMLRKRNMGDRSFVVRSAIDRLPSISLKIRQIYRDSGERTYQHVPLIRNSFSIVGEETLWSYISYGNSSRTDERTSRIHSTILIMRFLVLSGMRKLTFPRIMLREPAQVLRRTQRHIQPRVYVRGVEFRRDSALGMQRVQKHGGEFQSTRWTV